MKEIYRIDSITQTPEGYTFKVTLFADNEVYAGHFPGKPVVPGVITMKTVCGCISQATGRPLMFSTIKECKFLSVLIPETDLHIRVEATFSPEGRLRCTVSEAERTVLKLDANMVERTGDSGN